MDKITILKTLNTNKEQIYSMLTKIQDFAAESGGNYAYDKERGLLYLGYIQGIDYAIDLISRS